MVDATVIQYSTYALSNVLAQVLADEGENEFNQAETLRKLNNIMSQQAYLIDKLGHRLGAEVSKLQKVEEIVRILTIGMSIASATGMAYVVANDGANIPVPAAILTGVGTAAEAVGNFYMSTVAVEKSETESSLTKCNAVTSVVKDINSQDISNLDSMTNADRSVVQGINDLFSAVERSTRV